MKKHLLLLALTSGLILSACSDDNKPKNIKVPDKSQLNQTVYADDNQGKSGVSFTTTGPWTSTIKAVGTTRATADWVSISPKSGSAAGTYTIDITLGENGTGADRSAKIVIDCEGSEIAINITQKATKEDGNPVDGGIVGLTLSVDDEQYHGWSDSFYNNEKYSAFMANLGFNPYSGDLVAQGGQNYTRVYDNITYKYSTSPSIVEVKQVSGIEGITKIPSSGWTENIFSVMKPCKKGSGYIIRYYTRTVARIPFGNGAEEQEVVSTDADYWEDVVHVRVFVEDIKYGKDSDGVDITKEVKLKAQYPFEP